MSKSQQAFIRALAFVFLLVVTGFVVDSPALAQDPRLRVSVVGGVGSFTIQGPPGFNGGSPFVGTVFDDIVPSGDYTITFEEVPGYDLTVTTAASGGMNPPPPNNPVSGTLFPDTDYEITGTYASSGDGTLRVNVVNGGVAKFTIYGPNSFNGGNPLRASSYDSSVPAGNYRVVFDSRTGYSIAVAASASPGTPFSHTNPSEGFIDVSDVHEITATYVLEYGTLRVNVDMAGAGDSAPGAEGSFTIRGPSEFNGGEPWSGSSFNDTVPAGHYNITFDEVLGRTLSIESTASNGELFSSNNPSLGTIEKDSEKSVVGVYRRATGRLKVRAAGGIGSFTITGPGDFNGGNPFQGTEFNDLVPTGDYSVLFQKLDDYWLIISTSATIGTAFAQANPSTGAVNPDSTHEVIGRYSVGGALTVTLEPAEVRRLGAQWSMDGANWYESGATLENIKPGMVQVQFSKAPPYYEPHPLALEIKRGKTTSYTAVYGENNTKLEVTLYPEEIREKRNAKWSLDGINWHRSGKQLDRLSASTYTIQFGEVDGWTKPEDETVEIEDINAVYRKSARYVHGGMLKIFFKYSGQSRGGELFGRWCIDGGKNWHGEEDVLTNVPVGELTVQFKKIPGYITPAEKILTITGGEWTTFTAEYKRETGSLQVVISNNDITGNKGRWRLVDVAPWTGDGASVPSVGPTALPSQWFPSGYACADLETGYYYVEFKEVNGFCEPRQLTIKVSAGETAQKSGLYVRAATVTGRVVDTYGSPLWDVLVTITSGGRTLFNQQITAADKGFFEANKLPPVGLCTVSVMRFGYEFVPEKQNIVIEEPGKWHLPDFVGHAETKDGVIKGRVLDELNHGIAGATVVLNKLIKQETNKIGVFSFEGLGKGTYEVELEPQAGWRDEIFYQEVKLKLNQQAEVIFQRCRSDLKIRGFVTLGGGQKLEKENIPIVLKAYKTSSMKKLALYDHTYTKADGSFEFTGLVHQSKLPGYPHYFIEGWDADPYEPAFESQRVELQEGIGAVDFPLLYVRKTSQVIKYRDLLTIIMPSGGTFEKWGKHLWKAQGLIYLGARRDIHVEGLVEIDLARGEISGAGEIWIPEPNITGRKIILHSGGAFKTSLVYLLGGLEPDPQELLIESGGWEYELKGLELGDSGMKWITRVLFPDVFGETRISQDQVLQDKGGFAEREGFDIALPKLSYTLMGSEFEFFNFRIWYDPQKNKYGGVAKLWIPLVFGIDAALEFLHGELDRIRLDLSKSVPIGGPYARFFLLSLGGEVANLKSSDPLSIWAETSWGVNKIFKGFYTVKYQLETTIQPSGYYLGKGSIWLFMIETVRGMIEYDHQAKELALGLSFGIEDYAEVKGGLEVSVGDAFSMSGNLGGKLYLPLAFWKEDPWVDITSVNITADSSGLKFAGSLFGYDVEAELDKKGFRVTKPDYLEFIDIEFKENGKSRLRQGAGLPSLGSKKEHSIPDGLRAVHFLVHWEKGDTDPQIVAPSGVVYSGADQSRLSYYYKDEKAGLAAFRISHPEPGLWRVKLPREKSLGKVEIEVTKYGIQPGVAIVSAEETGSDQVLIKFNRSHLEGEQVELFYAKTKGNQRKHLIASAEQIGDATEWLWDTSRVKAGSYFIYARVNTEEQYPQIHCYEMPVVIEPRYGTAVDGKPSVKKTKRGVKVYWSESAGSELSFYKVYYSDDLSSDEYRNFIEVPGGEQSVTLDREYLKPGRSYKVALAGVYSNGLESLPSGEKVFLYTKKGANNIPYFTGKPKATVKAGRVYRYSVKATDRDKKDNLYFNLRSAPQGMRIGFETGRISWKTTAEDVGRHEVEIAVTDGKGGEETKAFTLFVKNPRQEGILEFRPVLDENGKRALVVYYRNPNLNLDHGKMETLRAVIERSSVETDLPLKLRECGLNSGEFAAYIPAKLVQQIIEQAKSAGLDSGSLANSGGLDTVVVRLKGAGRKESTAFQNYRSLR